MKIASVYERNTKMCKNVLTKQCENGNGKEKYVKECTRIEIKNASMCTRMQKN